LTGIGAKMAEIDTLEDHVITPSTRIRKSADQVSCELNGEVAILNLKSAQYFGLDPVGAHIWAALEGVQEVAALVSTVVTVYDVDEAHCTSDIIDLVTKLNDEGLIEIVTDA
ncbi:MAG: PqqD family protein, partial [Hyphomicrobiaceae bacterium]|nr:PqqD family protein [Hyphomicrobiaceae bacterium]